MAPPFPPTPDPLQHTGRAQETTSVAGNKLKKISKKNTHFIFLLKIVSAVGSPCSRFGLQLAGGRRGPEDMSAHAPSCSIPSWARRALQGHLGGLSEGPAPKQLCLPPCGGRGQEGGRGSPVWSFLKNKRYPELQALEGPKRKKTEN